MKESNVLKPVILSLPQTRASKSSPLGLRQHRPDKQIAVCKRMGFERIDWPVKIEHTQPSLLILSMCATSYLSNKPWHD